MFLPAVDEMEIIVAECIYLVTWETIVLHFVQNAIRVPIAKRIWHAVALLYRFPVRSHFLRLPKNLHFSSLGNRLMFPAGT